MRNALGGLVILIFILMGLFSFGVLLMSGIENIYSTFLIGNPMLFLKGALKIILSGPVGWVLIVFGSFIGVEIQIGGNNE